MDEEILQLKEECADDEECLFFYTRLVCGTWHKIHMGVSAAAIIGVPRAGVPKEWCERFHFPKQMALYFAKYGRNNCIELAKEYCRIFFNIWLEEVGGEEKFVYSDVQIASYQETERWIYFACGLAVDSPSFEKVIDILRLVPKSV